MSLCAKCGARNQTVRDLGGIVQCLACGHEAGTAVHPVAKTARLCTSGHPLVDGRCPTCIALHGHATKANAKQREGMKGAVRR